MPTRLPTAADLGQPDIPVSQRPISTYRGDAIAEGANALAQGVMKLGQGAQKVGEEHLDAEDRLAQSAATTAFINKKLELDEAALKDPDYETLPDRYTQQINGAVDDLAKQIKSPIRQAQFKDSLLRMRESGVQSTRTLARQKQREADVSWLNGAVSTGIDNAMRATSEDDRQVVFESLHDMIDVMASPERGAITGPDAAKLKKSITETYAERRAGSLVATNPTAASDLLKPTSIGPGGDAIFAKTGTWLDFLPPDKRATLYEKATFQGAAVHARTTADSVLAGADSQFQSAAPKSIVDAVVGQESGGRANAPTSVDGAVGKFQITPDTFARYAKPGEVIDNPEHNDAVGRRIIADLESKYPNDPARVAVAYFSGEGNVAPKGSPTPWVADKKDGNGKSVSSYVSDVVGRMGKGSELPSAGLVEPGNIDLGKRPVVRNADGSISTVRSMSFNEDGKEVLIPTVAADGSRILSNDEAIAQYRASGQHLGKFDTPENATAYAEQLHNQQAKAYAAQPVQTKADYYRQNYETIVEQARQQAIRQRPDDQRYIDLTVSQVQQRMNTLIRQQELAYKADNDLVYQAFTGALSNGKRPASVDELVATSPDVKAAWDRMQQNTPQAALAIETRIVTANTKTSDHDVKTYGTGFHDLFNRVHAPAGDENRISDVTQLYPLVGDKLTIAGLDKLRGEISGRGTPEGTAVGEMKKAAVAYAKHMLSFEADYGTFKIPDPKGMDAFNVGFLPAFYAAYDAGIAAGKTPYQLLSKDSPDFIVDKVAAPFKRPANQEMQDRIAAGAISGAQQPAGAVDLSTQDGIVRAYKSGAITYDIAADALMKGGFAEARPAVPVR